MSKLCLFVFGLPVLLLASSVAIGAERCHGERRAKKHCPRPHKPRPPCVPRPGVGPDVCPGGDGGHHHNDRNGRWQWGWVWVECWPGRYDWAWRRVWVSY